MQDVTPSHARSLPLQNPLGHLITPANAFARQFDETYATVHQQFDLILFLDGNEQQGRSVVAGTEAFRSSWKRPKWHIHYHNKGELMARIVYGVSGEGDGHSSRARVVLEHLCRQGHQVKVVTYDRGIKNLGSDFDIFESVGLHIVSRNNKVAPLETLLNNLQKIPEGITRLQVLLY